MSDEAKLWVRQLSDNGPDAQREYDQIIRLDPARFKLRTIRGLKAPGWIVVLVEYGDINEVQLKLEALGYMPRRTKPDHDELSQNPWLSQDREL